MQIYKRQPNLILPFYEDKKICPASALKEYLTKTKSLRGATKLLFISFRTPYKKISTQTIKQVDKNHPE